MDERRATVLRTVVESFIDSNQPVGSVAVLSSCDLDVSAATVRNELAALESDGYLTQPHTSAGRVPTEAGYRHFVNQLGPGALGDADRRRVRSFFAHAQGRIERLLADTSRMLSDLTECAAMIVAPSPEHDTIRSVRLVDLGAGRLLAVLVTSSGAVDRAYVDVFAEPLASVASSPRVLDAASETLAGMLQGAPRGSTGTQQLTGDPSVDMLVAASLHALGDLEAASGEVYVGGAARVTERFDAVSSVTSVLSVLEEQLLVVSLLRDLVDRGLSVAIGSETGMAPLADCSVVVASYEADGEAAGSVGLLGPTRMDYPKAIAVVGEVSRRLSKSLREPVGDTGSQPSPQPSAAPTA